MFTDPENNQTVAEFGANVGVLQQLCPEFDITYMGCKPNEQMYVIAMREMYANAVKMVVALDRAFVEWGAGKLINLARADRSAGAKCDM